MHTYVPQAKEMHRKTAFLPVLGGVVDTGRGGEQAEKVPQM